MSGLVCVERLFVKRLERGRFTAPWQRGESGPMEMTVSELALFLEGSHLPGKVRLSPRPYVLGPVFVSQQQG